MTDFQNQMEGQSVGGMTDAQRVDKAFRMCSGLFMEVAELQDSFSWKLCRDINRGGTAEFDKPNIRREIVDCLFFLHHIAECFGITPNDLNQTFVGVMANNRRRHIDKDFSNEEVEEESREKLYKLTEKINSKLDRLINSGYATKEKL